MKYQPCLIGDGSKIAIVGGGPAGSFFALYLRHFARLQGLHPEITIYQQRSFADLGPKGCKGCAGIISPSLMKNLAELNLTLPPEVIQTVIEGFAVHSPHGRIDISNPEKDAPIVSVYRGGGPRISHYEKNISFDDWLLQEAGNNDVDVKKASVSRIWAGSPAGLEVAGERINCELVVLAAGVNAKSIPVDNVAYQPPPTHVMAMNELYVGAECVRSCLDNIAHAFVIPQSGMIFGTLVPKGDFITLSVLSSNKYPLSIGDFLNYPIVKDILPRQYDFACGCRPHTLIATARNYYADGFVAIGDAGVTRLYKDGIGSSLLLARTAAQTVIRHGAGRRDFSRRYRPAHRSMHRDNLWGQLLFSLNDRLAGSRIFFQAQQRLIGNEQENPVRQPFTKAAWGMFTGSYSYRNIAKKIFNPLSLVKMISALAKEEIDHLSHSKEEKSPRKIYVGVRKVLILGSGFGATYTLRHLVSSTNRNEKVAITLVSNENYFLFTPLLHEVAMGSVEAGHIAYPIRRLHWRDRFSFIQAEVTKIDLPNRQVITTKGKLDFDCLVLSLGSIPDKSQLQLEGGHAFTLKTLHDAIKLRNHIIDIFEQAAIETVSEKQRQLLTFVVVGGGYIGIQAVAELRDFIFENLLPHYKTIDSQHIRIMLIEAREEIVERMDRKLSTYIKKQLEKMRIEVRTKSQMTRAWEGHVEINGQEVIPADTLLWSTGMVSHPLIAGLDAAKDNLGRVRVNNYLEVPGFPGVYALGDCAHFENPQTGEPIPPRAHTTVRQAKVVAHNILADIRGRDKRAYLYTDSGEIVSLGASRAAFRFYRLRLYGFHARLIWLFAYSLLVTGTYNRVRIVMDWFLSLIFGRDITFLNLKDH